MAARPAFSRFASQRAVLWRPVRASWSWLAPFGVTALPMRTYFMLAALALALELPGQFSIPATDRDESRYAEATKQMVLSGNFLDIRFGDQSRYVQPAGIYWLQAATTAPFGGAQAPIWAYRLPSMLAALANVLLLAWFGARVASPAAGLAAGLLLATSLLVTAEAHFAKIDSTLLLTVLLAQVSLYLAIEGERTKPAPFVGWPLVFWAALGAGVLLKGPVILAIVALTAAAYAAWNRSAALLLRLRPLLGIVLLLLLVAPWLIAVSVHTHGEFLKVAIGQSIGGKLAGTSDRHFGWPGYHTILFMLTFFPGIVLAGLGGIYAFVHRKEPLARFLVCWVVPTWLFFEVVPTKLPHYVLPVFPAVALLAALGLRADSQLPRLTWSRWVHRVAGILFVVASCALAALPIVAARRFGTPLGIPNFVACAAIVAVALAGISLWIKPTGDRLLPLVAAMILTYLSMFGLVIPSLDPLWASDRIAQRLKFLTGCQAVEIATAGFAEPSNLFHFGPSTFLGTGETAAHYLGAHTACGVGIVEASQRAPFDAAATSQGLKFLSFGGVAGYNYVKGRAIKLEILIPAGTRLRVTPKS